MMIVFTYRKINIYKWIESTLVVVVKVLTSMKAQTINTGNKLYVAPVVTASILIGDSLYLTTIGNRQSNIQIACRFAACCIKHMTG